MKTYEIQGHEVKQSSLTLEQWLQFFELLEEKQLSLEEVQKAMSGGIVSIVSFLNKNDMVYAFFKIILTGSENINIKELEGMEVLKIVSDFFFCNSELLKELSNILLEYSSTMIVKMKVMKDFFQKARAKQSEK
jgi:hypothetical protein